MAVSNRETGWSRGTFFLLREDTANKKPDQECRRHQWRQALDRAVSFLCGGIERKEVKMCKITHCLSDILNIQRLAPLYNSGFSHDTIAILAVVYCCNGLLIFHLERCFFRRQNKCEKYYAFDCS